MFFSSKSSKYGPIMTKIHVCDWYEEILGMGIAFLKNTFFSKKKYTVNLSHPETFFDMPKIRGLSRKFWKVANKATWILERIDELPSHRRQPANFHGTPNFEKTWFCVKSGHPRYKNLEGGLSNISIRGS